MVSIDYQPHIPNQHLYTPYAYLAPFSHNTKRNRQRADSKDRVVGIDRLCSSISELKILFMIFLFVIFCCFQGLHEDRPDDSYYQRLRRSRQCMIMALTAIVSSLALLLLVVLALEVSAFKIQHHAECGSSTDCR